MSLVSPPSARADDDLSALAPAAATEASVPPASMVPAERGRWALACAAGLGALAMVLAVIAVDPGGLRPFTTLRWPVVGATILVAAALAWPARTRAPRSIAAVGLAFVAWMALASIAAVDPAHAWWGHPARHLGFVAVLVCVAAFVVGTAIRTAGARRMLGRGSIVAAGLLALGAALDAGGLDLLAGEAGFGSRLGGTFGQPAYLGAAGVVLAPVALAAARAERGPWRIGGLIAGSAAALAVIASQTRGAWLGLAVAAAVAWPLLAPRSRRAWLLAGAGLVVLVGLAVLTPIGGRALATMDVADGTTRGRLDEWRVAVDTIAERPVLGAGPEGYRVVVPAHLDDEYSRRYGRAVGVDRAHDAVLDVAAVGGIPAAVLYVALVVLVLVRVRRVRRVVDPVVVGAAAAFSGAVVQQLVLFPIAEIDPIVWMLAGVVVAASVTPATAAPGPHGLDATAPSADERPKPDRGRTRQWLSGVMAVAVGALAIVLLAAGMTGAVADRHLAAAVRERDRGDQRAGLAATDAATALRPDDIDTWYVAAEVAASGPSLLDVDAGIVRVEMGLERSSQDPALLDLHEELLTERALRSDLAADLALAASVSTDRISADPSNPAHHRRLGHVRAAQGDREGAIASFERALTLDPDDAVAAAELERLAGAPA